MFPVGSSMWMLSILHRLLSMQCALLSIVFCLLSCPNACCQFSIGCGQLLCFLFSCSVRLARSPLTFAHRDFHGNLRSPTLECSRTPNQRPFRPPSKRKQRRKNTVLDLLCFTLPRFLENTIRSQLATATRRPRRGQRFTIPQE